jgi:hypothetical protein
MAELLQPAIAWLAALGVSSGVARSAPVYATVSAAHVLGIALLVGPVLLADLRLAGLLRGLDAAAIAILRRTAMLGVALAMGTGVLLLSAKPGDYAGNAVVWAKLAVIAAALANAARFELRWRRHGESLLSRGGGPQALLSAALWLAAILLGRWIAFV